MALRSGDRARSAHGSSKHEMSVEEFKKWLMNFDFDKDGKISQGELRAAIRSRGGWFMTTRKSGRAISDADADGSGYIEENEIDSLLDFAERTMGFKFY